MPELPIFAVQNEQLHALLERNGNSGHPVPLANIILPQLPQNSLDLLAPSEATKAKATFYILQDLAHRGWSGYISPNGGDKVKLSLNPGETPASKAVIRDAMTPRRLELIRQNANWIRHVEPDVLKHLANGNEIDPSKIRPEIEVCSNKDKHIFRYCRFLSSVPYSDYVGRRIYFLIRDGGLPNRPIMGVAALGSSLLQITSRDKWIGWDTSELREIKKQRIGNLMDLYVAVSLPPYSYLLGGKLVCLMMASNWVREIFADRYQDQVTLSKKRIIKDLVLLVTTSVYGKHSSQYNRLRYDDREIYVPVGETAGFGTLHFGNESFASIREMLSQEDTNHSNVFGEGANWRLRVVRDGLRHLGFNPEECLNHGHSRGVYAVPLARNVHDFLCGRTDEIDYYDNQLEALIEHWRTRWLNMRVQTPGIMQQVENFNADSLRLTHLLV